MRNISLFIFFSVVFGNLIRWINCIRLEGPLYYSSLDLSLRLQEAIREDKGVAIPVVRLFHNKVTFFINDLFNNLSGYLDPLFLISLLSVLGLFGFLCFFVALFEKKKIHFLALSFLLLVTFFEMFFGKNFSYSGKALMIFVPYFITSLLGFRYFQKKTEGRIALILTLGLGLVSLWWLFVFGKDLIKYCTLG